MRRVIFSLVLVLVVGCATYATRIREPRHLLEFGQYDRAIEQLEKLVERQDNDQLLYLMDLGLAYHRAQKYEKAVEVFLKADRLAEIKDYTSLSEEAGSILLSDEVKPYKGENFEKILINVYLALDFTLLNRFEDALVECRKVNHKLDLMISEGKLPFERNAFAKYLAASLFEAEGELNDAFVDYRQVHRWRGPLPFLGEPILRMASRLKAEQELEEYRKAFPKVKSYRLGKSKGEVMLIVEQGRSPIKVPNPSFVRLPMFRRRPYGSERVRLYDGKHTESVESAPYFDIESTAVRELENKTAGIIAKKIAGVVVKEVVAHQIEKQTDSPLAGFLARLFLHGMDTADLRSWSTLPARLHVARIALPAGRHDISVDMLGRDGSEVRGVKTWPGVEVRAGKIVFLSYRTVD